MVTFLVYSAIIILLPLIPAFILYRFLPSKTTVGGPFKGLSARLQGAFGGYFLLVLVLGGVLVGRERSEATYPRYEEWEISGKLKFPEGTTGADLAGLRFILVPSKGQALAEKLDADRVQSFWTVLPVIRTGPDSWDVPYRILIDHADLWSVTLDPKELFQQPTLGHGAKQRLVTVIEMRRKKVDRVVGGGGGRSGGKSVGPTYERQEARP